MLGFAALRRALPPPTGSDGVFRGAFYLFLGCIAFSLAGSAALYVPGVQTFFAPYLRGLIITPTWLYMALMPVLSFLLYRRMLDLKRSVGFLVWGTLVGGVMELVGTTTGLPFGTYYYTDWLGPQLFGHVPYFIPPAWYAMGILAYDLAGRFRLGVAGRVVGGALLLVLWDVALDPAMSKAFPFWQYPDTYPPLIAGTVWQTWLAPFHDTTFFGMPVINWFGWFVTGLLVMGGYERLFGPLPEDADGTRLRWVTWLFALNFLFPIGVSMLYGIPLAGVIGLLALVAPFAFLRWRTPTPTPTPV